MIAQLYGTLAEKNADSVVLDVQGVGYHLHISLQTLASLPAVGQTVRLWTHLHIREDAWSLYGFTTAEERELFLRCISVSGVGPKLGLALLSGLEPSHLLQALQTADVAALCRIPGIGKKTAERLVLELQDKLSPTKGRGARSSKSTPSFLQKQAQGPVYDIANALVNLGYTAHHAETAAEQALRENPEANLADGLRAALRLLQR